MIVQASSRKAAGGSGSGSGIQAGPGFFRGLPCVGPISAAYSFVLIIMIIIIIVVLF